MRKNNFADHNLTKKISDLNRKAMAHEKIVSLDAYRTASKTPEMKTILVVDDEPVMRSALKRIFEKENYRVLVAKDAMEFSKIIENTKLDLILLDIQLPWVSGYEVCTLIKSNPLLNHLPVAFVSGNKTEDDIRKGFEAGCDDYITKPFEIDAICRMVTQLLLKSG